MPFWNIKRTCAYQIFRPRCPRGGAGSCPQPAGRRGCGLNPKRKHLLQLLLEKVLYRTSMRLKPDSDSPGSHTVTLVPRTGLEPVLPA